MLSNYQGVITALVTPFTDDNRIDVEALRQLVRFQLDSGVSGLVACGSTGEAATLSEDEYRLVVQTVAQEVAGRVPVIAGAGSNDTQKAIRISQVAQEAGAVGLLHVLPYYNKPTPNGIVAHFAAIASAVDLPIIAYNVPGRTGSNLTVTTLLRLIKEVPSVVAVKEASGDIMQIMEVIAKTPEDFVVLSGDDALTLPIIALGGKGIISVASNEIPAELSQLVQAALAGEWDTAKQLHYEWLDLMQANFIESNPIPVKTALAMMGKIQEVFRLPLTPLEDNNRQTIEQLLRSHKLI